MAIAAQHIRFCTTDDGVRLAYAVTGEGPPLVRTATWLSHLEYEWLNPIRRPTLDVLSRHFSLVRYDQRGCGLSDWNVQNISFEAWVEDLDTVVRAAGLHRFSLLGGSQGCAIAIAYAARYPEKVSHLMLYGGYAVGKLKRDSSERQRDEARTLIKIIELGWGKETREFRQVFTTHSVTNPLDQITAAIHVYGGDFFATQRSEWNPRTFEERPYDVADTLRAFEESNARLGALRCA